ncbi:MAG: peptide chain release factor N(5)-glutamine methyltransferase [Oscillospiraceae bacterium]|nr:peptide chain release factor N(5)-glutamine methyltransferase [Oscillospiraceae bacterium]
MVNFEKLCMIEQITGNKYPASLTPEQEKLLASMMQRREQGEPLQYILGEWEFYGLKIFVGKGVLIPRPETELLIDKILEFSKNRKNLKILDLCTGSGCIALALKKFLPDAEISAVDTSEKALSYAQKNIDFHHLEIKLFHESVLNPEFAQQFQNYDIIVSNPPYLTSEEMADLQIEVQHEPAIALSGGSPDGTYFYQKITNIWKNSLKSGGLLAYEIGWKQASRVREILNSNAFQEIQVFQDYEHRDRVVTGRKFEKLFQLCNF